MFQTKQNTLKHRLRVYLNNEVDINKPTHYINNYTGEISNHPILESIYTILDSRVKLIDKVLYILKWKYEIH